MISDFSPAPSLSPNSDFLNEPFSGVVVPSKINKNNQNESGDISRNEIDEDF